VSFVSSVVRFFGTQGKEITMPEDAVAQLRRSRERLDAEVAQFSDDELLRKGLIGEWSVKDLMAHIAAWDAWLARAVAARIQNGELPPEMLAEARDPDPFNARAVEQWQSLDAQTARAAFRDSFAELMRYLEPLNPDDLYRPIPRPRGGTTNAASSITAICAHNDGHCAQLGEVLSSLHQGS
jgi:uncharacterized protein (TIGR03083 family)